MTSAVAFQKCLSPNCGETFDVSEVLTQCPSCGELLDVEYEWDRLPLPHSLERLPDAQRELPPTARNSGVWKYHCLLPFVAPKNIVSVGEGKTILQKADSLGKYLNHDPDRLFLQYEGMNPSGSFKDNGMTAAFSHASLVNAKFAACASTGNTSASLAMYAAVTQQLRSIIFIGSGKIAFGKLSQALDYGAMTIQIDGDFDDAMRQVKSVCPRLGIYLVNSVNPFRIEGQKTIMLRVLESLNWQVPDWIIVPGGNLGNSSSFGKMFGELQRIGLLERVPRLAVINAAGASTLDKLYNQEGLRFEGGSYERGPVNDFFEGMTSNADTIASAIEINRPVNLSKCLRALEICDGVVEQVTDQEIIDAKSLVGAHGMGCEPASAASIAGLRKLKSRQVIGKDEKVVCILTGHQLKDPDATVAYHSGDREKFNQKLGVRGVQQTPHANMPVQVANETDKIVAAIESRIIQMQGTS